MEEIKKEEVVEVVKTTETKDKYEQDYQRLVEGFDKLLKDNEILKKEIISLKESGVNVSPEPKEIKKHEVNKDLWKDTF